MFNQAVSLMSDFPEVIKRNILIANGTMDNIDDTLLMTSVVLLHTRVNDYKVEIAVNEKDNVEQVLISDNAINPNIYSFYWFQNAGIPDKLIKPVEGRFETIEKLSAHENFLSNVLETPIYIRTMPKENTVCIFTARINYAMVHAVTAIMGKLFPIFKEKPLTKNEISLMETLSFSKGNKYFTKIVEFLNSESFKRYGLRFTLSSFEKKLYEKKVAAAKEKVTQIEEAMEAALERYRAACEKRLEAVATYEGLKNRFDQTEEHTELEEYLFENKCLSCVSIDGNFIKFNVKTFLAPHHIEDWDAMSGKRGIFMRYTTNKDYNTEEVKLLLDSILSSKRCMKLKMCAYFSIDYFGSQVTSMSRRSFADMDNYIDYIPNPHLYYHNCFGQNKMAILDQLVQGDIVGAIACCIVCAQRVNIHESMSFDPFVENILANKGKCLVGDDGTEYTVKEAIEYLKGKQNEQV